MIGLLCIAVFAAGHHPWSVTFGFTVWGAKIATLFGADFSQAEFWQWAGPKRALGDSILSDTSSLTRPGHDPRRHGCGRRLRAVRAQSLAAAEVAARRRASAGY